jgi:hypothetical protein
MVVDALLETIKIWMTGLIRGSAFWLLCMVAVPNKSLTIGQLILCYLAGLFWEYANEK